MPQHRKRLLTDDGHELAIDLVERGTADERLIARVTLVWSDFLPARAETWWAGVRRAVLEPDLEAHQVRLLPGKDHGRGRLAGFSLELADGARRHRRHFSIESLSHVAQRKMLELVEGKEAQLDDTYNFFLRAVPADGDSETPVETVSYKSRTAPLMLEEASLSDYLRHSEPLLGQSDPLEPGDDPAMHLFVSAEVWEEGRELARRGGTNESAALTSGRLMRDTASPEVFVLIDACLPAEQADEQKLSVTFTPETWARTNQLLNLRRKRLNRPHEIVVGSLHGHNFPPEADSHGRRMCDACSVARHCSRSTAVPSAQDFEWHRAVFSGQPWATLLIHGYTAREEEDFRLYALQDARFQQCMPRRLLT